MSKVTDAMVAAIVAKFENGDVPDGTDFSNLITAIQEAAQDHEHNAEGGSGNGTGDASQVAWGTGVSGKPSTYAPTAHTHDERYFTETEHLNATAGVGDAGKPIKLNAAGVVDPSMYTGGGAGPQSTDYGSRAYLDEMIEMNQYTIETIPFTAVTFDPESCWSGSTGKWTCPLTGRYFVTATIRVTHADAEVPYEVQVTLRVNTVNINVVDHYSEWGGDSGRSILVEDVLELVEDDVVDIRIFNGHAADLMVSDGTLWTHCAIHIFSV